MEPFVLMPFGLGDDRLMRMVYLVLLLLLVASGLTAYRNRWPQAMRHAALWVLVFLGILTLYAYRAPIERFAAPVLAVLDPGRVIERVEGDGSRALEVGRSADGHFHVDALANGVTIDFLVDTGATSTVLTFSDAARAGIAVEDLQFDRPVQTANGMAFAARARLDTLQVGSFLLRDVAVGIMPDGVLTTSLLGLNVLDRFDGWRMRDDRLVLELAG